MDSLLDAVPLIVASLVPPLFALMKKWLGDRIPDHMIPVLLPAAGGILAALGQALGLKVDPDVVNGTADTTLWEAAVTGILMGSAAVGIHQIKKQNEGDKGEST